MVRLVSRVNVAGSVSVSLRDPQHEFPIDVVRYIVDWSVFSGTGLRYHPVWSLCLRMAVDPLTERVEVVGSSAVGDVT